MHHIREARGRTDGDQRHHRGGGEKVQA
jgi:hypothetical protein